MIAQVSQHGSILVLRDNTGSQINTILIGNGEFLGHSGKFVVIQYGDMIVTMNENQSILGRIVLDSRYRISGITDSGFHAKTGSMIIAYNSMCEHINSFSV
ncbi:MAG: hypothetical protein WC123_04985 [Bacilli bacterium]|jgi:hypothetical protein